MNIYSLQTNYLNLDSSASFGKNSKREHAVHTKCKFCGGTNHYAEKCSKRIIKEKEKARAVDASDNRRTERTPRKCFICGSEYHMITKCPNPPKDNENGESKYVLMKKVIFNETTARITVTKIYMHL